MSVATPEREDSEGRRTTRAGRIRARGIDWFAVAGLGLLALFLAPALRAGFRADDTWVSEERGIVTLSGGGLFDHLWGTAQNFWNSGRPNVLGTTEGLLGAWFLGDHPMLKGAWLVVLTIAAAGVLYALARELGLPREGSLLTLVLLAGAIQFRSYHDPMLGYFGSIQVVLILTLGSLLLLIRGLRRRDRRLVIASFLVFFPCPLIYEGSYTLVALHLAVALLELRGKAAIKAAAPFLALSGFFVLLSLYTRANATVLVEGYEVGSSPLAAVRTFIIQLVAPLPASNIVFRADFGTFLPLGTNPTKAELLAGAWRGAAVFALTLVLSLRWRPPAGRTLRDLAVIGVLLWLSSVAVVSMAPKYQLEIVPGKGHLPALIQVFGWSFVAVAGLGALIKPAAARSVWALRLTALGAAGLLGVAAAFVGYNNLRVIALETPIVQARGLLERATEDGAFASLPRDSSLVFSQRDMGWPTGSWAQVPDAAEGMFLEKGGRRFDIRFTPAERTFDCPRTGAFPPQPCERLSNKAAWVSVRDYRAGGSVVIAHLPAGESKDAASAPARALRAYVHRDEGAPRPPALFGSTERGRPWRSRGQRWQRVDGDGDWAVYETRVTGPAPVASSIDDVDARMSFAQPPPPDQIVRLYGTKRLLP